MSTVNSQIRAGDVQFFDNYVPVLEADQYSITAAQTITSSDTAHPLSETFNTSQNFLVLAPRFALPPEDVQSVFPPRNATGIFDQSLAHIVLNQRVLPWERLIVEGESSTSGTPWMALLLFTEDQIVPPAGTAAPSALTNPTLAGSYPVSSTTQDSLLNPTDSTILGPAVTLLPHDETSCKAIDISTTVFEQVVPLQTELPYLAHVREAGAALDHKASDQASGSGWFSVVIGNRFPAASDDSSDVRYIAHLVSLEGFYPYLVPSPAWPQGLATVRLASLASWSFTSKAEAGNFAALALNLVASPIASLELSSGGSGYTSAPDVVLSGGGGNGAQAAVTVTEGAVSSVTLIQPGSGYTSSPTVTFEGGGGTGAAAIATPQGVGGDMLRLRLQVSGAAQTPGSTAANVQTALQNGYNALAYDTRVGDRTFGWYHGPLVPNPIETFSQGQPFESSAAATVYDSSTGLFDLTYAAAWETGRMLALSARSHSASVMALKKNLRRSLHLLRERTRAGGPTSQPALTPLAAANGHDLNRTAEALNQALEHRARSHSFIEWMSSDLGKRIPFPGARAIAPLRRQASDTPRPASADSSAAAPTAHHQLSTMVARPEVKALLSIRLNMAITEPQFSVGLDWLAGLRLLEDLPFSALVPNAAMLPAESIRFFYVDPNYLNALSDGANSIGVQTTGDVAHNRALRGPLRQAAIARAAGLRRRRIGRPSALTATQEPSDPVTGFLLRSAIVSGWPGLEIRAYAAIQPGSDPLAPDPASIVPPVRLERMAPDVLLCLYPKIPVWIEIDEPKEALAFGVEDPSQAGGYPQVALRYIDESAGPENVGKVIGGKDGAVTFDTAKYLRNPSTWVVNVGSWQAELASKFTQSKTKWGSAAFAIQMVRAPEQMVFQIQPNPAPPESAFHG